jgi:hypothetical protein
MIVLCTAFLLAAQPDRAPQDSPRNHQIHVATSADGLTWEETQAPVMRMASVPDIIELSGKGSAGAAGTLVIYTVDFRNVEEPGRERIARLVSTDGGKTWDEPRPIAIEGKTTRWAAVDPSVVQLEDGRLRLYFYEMLPRPTSPRDNPGIPGVPTIPINPRPHEPPREAAGPKHRILSAVSDDGLTFRPEEGERLALEGITDSEVIQSGGEWLMFLSRGEETLLAYSKDGLKFEHDTDFVCRDGGVPGAIGMDDGTVRAYLSGRRGIVSTIYDPGRGTFKPDGGLRVRGPCADPAVWRLANGAYVMVLKRFTDVEEREEKEEDPEKEPIRVPGPPPRPR